jgi:hypothetical protein
MNIKMSQSRLIKADKLSVLWEVSEVLDRYLEDDTDDEAYADLRSAYQKLEQLPEASSDPNIRDAIDAYATDQFTRMQSAIGRALDS